MAAISYDRYNVIVNGMKGSPMTTSNTSFLLIIGFISLQQCLCLRRDVEVVILNQKYLFL